MRVILIGRFGFESRAVLQASRGEPLARLAVLGDRFGDLRGHPYGRLGSGSWCIRVFFRRFWEEGANIE